MSWIRIDRKILKNPLMQNKSVLLIWLYILLKVEYKPQKALFEGKEIILKPGQGLFTMREIGAFADIDRSATVRAIKKLRLATVIATVTDHRNTLITVVRWNEYQTVATPNAPVLQQSCNSLELSSNIYNKEQYTMNNNIPPIPPKGKRKVKPKISDEELTVYQERFNTFWIYYPRHIAKKEALKSFLKIKPDEALFERILGRLKLQLSSEQWVRDNGKYIPYPSTWLNQERWNDEVEPQSKSELSEFIEDIKRGEFNEQGRGKQDNCSDSGGLSSDFTKQTGS